MAFWEFACISRTKWLTTVVAEDDSPFLTGFINLPCDSTSRPVHRRSTLVTKHMRWTPENIPFRSRVSWKKFVSLFSLWNTTKRKAFRTENMSTKLFGLQTKLLYNVQVPYLQSAQSMRSCVGGSSLMHAIYFHLVSEEKQNQIGKPKKRVSVSNYHKAEQ